MSRRKSFANQFTKSLRACVESLERRQLLSLTVPALSSLPGSPHNLYLDFDGDPGNANVQPTPAFSLDRDITSFSNEELAAIRQIWSAVADAYSPFDVNVTTVYPGANDRANVTLGVLFGGNTSGFEAGESPVGAFHFTGSRSLVFAGINDPGLLADVAEHEAGHGFGLWHQSTPTDEYRPFSGPVGAIMSASYNTRTLWWDGYSSGLQGTQDDMAVLAGVLGYRADDRSNSPTAGASLVMSNGAAQATGIISNDSDQDWFTLNWTGGPLTIDALGATYSNRLDPRLEVRDASGANLLASGEDSAVGQLLHVSLPAGTYRIGVMSGSHLDNGVSTHYGEAGEYTLSVNAGTTTGESPFNGTPLEIGPSNPTTIQYENYDFGGEGVAYHVEPNTPSVQINTQNSYRAGDSVKLLFGGTSFGGDQSYVSYLLRPSEWTNYTVNIDNAGTYAMAFRSTSSEGGATFHLELDGQKIGGEVTVPTTGPNSYRTTVAPVLLNLPAGRHSVRFVFDSVPNGGVIDYGSIDWFQMIPASAGGQTPFGSTPFTVAAGAPSVLQAENFDNGGQAVAYNDSTPATNTGGAYRKTEGVDIKPTTDTGAGYRLSDAFAGEWLEYSINVATAGTYDVAVRCGSPGAGGAFHLELDGQPIGKQLGTPNTGSFDTMQDVTIHGVQLTAGAHILRLAFDTNSAASGAAGGFNYIRVTPVAAPAVQVAAADPNATYLSTTDNNVVRADPGRFTFTRTGPTDTDLWVNFNVTGTALKNGAYQSIGQAVLIPAGQKSVDVTVNPNGGSNQTSDTTVVVTLLSSAFYTVSTPSTATVTIHTTPVDSGQISGVIFNDFNGNGLRENGEGGVPFERVYIDQNNNGVLDASELSTFPDASGSYKFFDLPAGTYIVRPVLIPLWKQTAPASGVAWTMTLAAGQSVTGKDFGVLPPSNASSIAGTIFNDANGNGIRDTGEAGIAGRTVYIDVNNNSTLDSNELSTTTDSTGAYTFPTLGADTYKIRQVLPTGWNQTTPSKGYGWSVTLAANQTASGKDFGARQTLVATASILGQVFNDKDGDGTKDSNEAGIAGRKVWIDLDNDGVLDSNEQTVMTDSNGNYKFTSLAAGTYKVRQLLPTGWKQTTPAKGYGWSVTLTARQGASGKSFGAKSG